jgi:hydroxypyruvate isomerase
MKNIGVCLDPFFTDLEYPDRIRKIAALGFTRYEFWFHDKAYVRAGLVPAAKDFNQLAEINQELGLEVTDIVYNHCDGGVLAALVDSRDKARLVDGFGAIAELAAKIGCRSFISASGNRIPGQSRERSLMNIALNLEALAKEAARFGATILLEPWNTKIDHPDNFLDDATLSAELIKSVGSPNVKLLFDIYHMQIMGGDLLSFLAKHLSIIGHFHIAGVPGRHEPYACELNYRFIVDRLSEMGYAGSFGLEYWPTIGDGESLQRTLEYLTGN